MSVRNGPRFLRGRRTSLWIAVCSAVVIGVTALALTPPISSAPITAFASAGQSNGTLEVAQLDKRSNLVVLAWNDLGMHCINPRYKHLALLPPFNNLWVQVLRKGEEPDLVSSGIRVFYTFPKNKSVHGKTDFWQYANALFGANLREGVGLTGNGLEGELKQVRTPYLHYEVTGIPILPKSDDGLWDPFQVAIVTVTNSRGNRVLARAQVTVPVSDEIHCERCHSDGGVGGFKTGIVEVNILSLHDSRHSTNLVNQQPVLCARCHSDNALGAAGQPGVSSLSAAMHSVHGKLAGDKQPRCYDCHPGDATQCNRSAIEGMGPKSATDPNCQHCHGSLLEVGTSAANGRRPWLDEPQCSDCHDTPNTDTRGKLYRMTSGHGGVACEACHNSPHAWYPSLLTQDNWQPLKYQGNPGPIGRRCQACHTNRPEANEGPHGREGGDDLAAAAGAGKKRKARPLVCLFARSDKG